MLDRRVDLLIGALDAGPSGGGYNAEMISATQFVFAVSPQHLLAAIKKPLGKAELYRYKANTVSDTVRKMQLRTVGLLFWEDTLTLPDMPTK